MDEMVPYDNDMSVATTLFEHLTRSFDYIVNHKGPHNLPLIGRADWNDCLNLNCFSKEPGESFQTFGPSDGPVAESVFIAGMFVKYGKEYADLCDALGKTEESARARKEINDMVTAIEKDGWDGECFDRAYDAAGEKIGSKECEEGQIYIEPQGFCVLAGVGLENGMAEKALDSVKERFFGEAKNSWLTGTAAWTFMNVSQYILGVQPTLKGLSINPCVPSDFGGFNITRKYRDVTYQIKVENPYDATKPVVDVTVIMG